VVRERALILLAAVSAVAAVGLAVFGVEAATAALAVSMSTSTRMEQ
jgi:hypothetical protein